MVGNNIVIVQRRSDFIILLQMWAFMSPSSKEHF